MNLKPVYLLGGGGHAAVAASVLRLCGRSIGGYLANEPTSMRELAEVPYIGKDDSMALLNAQESELVVAVGSIRGGDFRARLFARGKALGFHFAQIRHPSAIIAASVSIAEGVQIMAGAILQPMAIIDANTIINTGAIIEHGCRIGRHAHVASGTILCGDVIVGEGTHVGAGAVVLQGRSLGVGATIGAGACVTRDVEAGVIVAGNPARVKEG